MSFRKLAIFLLSLNIMILLFINILIWAFTNGLRPPILTLAPPDTSFTLISKADLGLTHKSFNEAVRTYYNKTVQPPGIVLILMGRLGNQLFQYACHYALAKKLGFPLYISLSKKQLKNKDKPRLFSLDKLKIPIDNLVDDSTKLYNKSSISEQDVLENKLRLRFQNDLEKRIIVMASFCKSREFWVDYQDDIRAMFEPREEALGLSKHDPILKKIKDSESVAVHVRRGDFITLGIVTPISFQRAAIRKMAKLLEEKYDVKQPIFFVFSDQIEYAVSMLKDLEKDFKLVYVSKDLGKKSTAIDEFYLMTECKHNIFSSSTFSWWAAYLNKNKRKIVITAPVSEAFYKNLKKKLAPADYNFTRRLHETSYYPKEWIVLTNFDS